MLGRCGTVLAVGAAGCLDGSDAGPASSPGERGSRGRNGGETDSDGTTVPASALSDAAAKEQALVAEDDYLRDRLSDAACLDEWGTSASVASEEATVVERTADGVTVAVTHPFWWSRPRTQSDATRTVMEHADGASEARYLVTAADAERVSGDDVSPC